MKKLEDTRSQKRVSRQMGSLSNQQLASVGGGCKDLLIWFWGLFEDNTKYEVDSDTAVA